jgi:hypothetical protein
VAQSLQLWIVREGPAYYLREDRTSEEGSTVLSLDPASRRPGSAWGGVR